MRIGKLVVLCMVVILAVAGMAMAVGFESIDLNGKLPEKTSKTIQKSSKVPKQQVELAFVDRCPFILDEAVEMMKDLLGQFGVLERKAP